VAAAFIPKTPAGWDLPTPVGRFAWFVAWSIIAVAVGAAVAWADVYIRCGVEALALIEGIALAFGIVAVALMSLWVASAVARNAP
jgi:hypothetical protein